VLPACETKADSLDLSVCILTHSQPVLLPRCVAACASEIDRAGLAAEIIIVDNASADAYPQQVARTYPDIRIITTEENLGFSAGNNLAIRQSRGRYVLILNDDAVLQQDALRLLVESLDADGTLGAAGPRFLNPDGSPQLAMNNSPFPTPDDFLDLPARIRDRGRTAWKYLAGPRKAGPIPEAEYLAGACLLVRHAALNKVGLLDEKFRFWFEDVDLCYRLGEAGWRLRYVREAPVIHYVSASTSKLAQPEKQLVYFQSALHYLGKHSSFREFFWLRAFLAASLVWRCSAAPLYAAISARGNFRWAFSSARASLRLLPLVVWGGALPGQRGPRQSQPLSGSAPTETTMTSGLWPR
jgi:N-acetylglucosaminyl-diphospho-decaprenol L-rhamnosyltransferase